MEALTNCESLTEWLVKDLGSGNRIVEIKLGGYLSKYPYNCHMWCLRENETTSLSMYCLIRSLSSRSLKSETNVAT